MKTCLVTGASRGIGSYIVNTLKSDGFDVVGLARSKPDDWTGQFIECDLSDATSIAEASRMIANLGELWCLINNAGMGRSGAIDALEFEDFQHVMTVNTIAPAMMMKAVSPVLVDGGRVVNLCSTVMRGKEARSIYGASKAALASMTRTWALELAPRNILVNAVSPGAVDTSLFRRRNPVGSESEQAVLSGIPLRRIAQPRDVARAISFLVSPETSHITGQIFTIDGGATIAASTA